MVVIVVVELPPNNKFHVDSIVDVVEWNGSMWASNTDNQNGIFNAPQPTHNEDDELR